MKTISRLISAATNLALTFGLVFLMKTYPQPAQQLYPRVSQWILGAVGSVTAKIPLPLWEIMVVLGVLWLIFTLIRAIRKLKFLRWVSGVVWTASFLLFTFVLFWGGGHLLPTKTEQILTMEEYSVETLAEATSFFAGKLDEAATAVDRDAEGKPKMAEFSRLAEQAAEDCNALSDRYSVLPRVEALTAKKLLGGPIFGYLGVTGIFVPLTAEATVSPHTYPASLPFTICHEMSHRLGACAEEDANFLAFLACVDSGDIQFRYSAWYSAFLYCYNSLYEASPETAAAIVSGMTPQARADMFQSVEHYKPYEGPVQEAADKVNDTYLKAAGQEAGIRSYGLVSDALVSWYRQNAA